MSVPGNVVNLSYGVGTYTFAVDSSFDTVIELRNVSGTTLVGDDDHGNKCSAYTNQLEPLDSCIFEYTITTSGIYRLWVREFSNTSIPSVAVVVTIWKK